MNFSSSVTICTHVNYITGQWNFSTLNHIHSLPQLFQERLLCCYICTSNWGYLEWSISYYMIRSRMLGLYFWSWRLIEVKSSYLWNDSTPTYTINRSAYLSSIYTFMYIPYQRFVRPLPEVCTSPTSGLYVPYQRFVRPLPEVCTSPTSGLIALFSTVSVATKPDPTLSRGNNSLVSHVQFLGLPGASWDQHNQHSKHIATCLLQDHEVLPE